MTEQCPVCGTSHGFSSGVWNLINRLLSKSLISVRNINEMACVFSDLKMPPAPLRESPPSMPMRLTFDRRFRTELRSALATLQCLSDYAAEQGDGRSAAILGNAAGLLELSLVSNAKALVRPPVPTREQPAETLA